MDVRMASPKSVKSLFICAHLVELEVVQEIIKLSVLGTLLKLDVMLLQTVQSELSLVIDVDFKRLKSVKQISMLSFLRTM